MGVIKSVGGFGFKAFGVASPFIQYSGSRKEGHGVGYSVGRAALDGVLYSSLTGALGFALMGKDVAVGAFNAANEVGKHNASVSSKAYQHNFGGNFADSEKGATMRQRGVQAIQRNGLNARSVLGSEARQYLRSGY